MQQVAARFVGEWTLRAAHDFKEPFAAVVVDAQFTAPSGRIFTMPGFYDGDQTWRVRFSPDETGVWSYAVTSRPVDQGLSETGAFEVVSSESKGFLKATPGDAWGFRHESGEALFVMGDTVYNLFGAAHCGIDVVGFLARRAAQGFNTFRVRCQVSPFHPPDGVSAWQTRRTWPWGGSEQSPRFDRFNLEYFRTVDHILREAASLGVGFEMIMEAWGFEYPFNDRGVFVSEWEDLWLRYLIARYDAYRSVHLWTLMNEYEYYPDGDWRHSPLADRWAMRRARWIKDLAPHGHPIAVHNGPQMPPFARRFALDSEAVDVIVFQDWGTTGPSDGWLTAGIEESIAASFEGWPGAAVFAEYGYERDPGLPLTFPGFTHCDADHTRRGAWRGAFCGMGVMNGFENSWGPVMALDRDLAGVRSFELLQRFVTQVIPFDLMQPAPELLIQPDCPKGYAPLVLADRARDVVAVYLPAGGSATLSLAERGYTAQWYDPATGDVSAGKVVVTAQGLSVVAPSVSENSDRPQDWALTLVAPAVIAQGLGLGKIIR